MKNYKKGIFTATFLSTMSLMAAESKTIQVTTMLDTDDNNSCSLRQAIRTAYENKSYGSCNVGNKLPGQRDYIQLEKGEYMLTRGELKLNSPISIYGALPFDEQAKDPLKGTFPAQLDIQTSINAQGQSRIFNTVDSGARLEINNIALKNGYAKASTTDYGNGGALFIGGMLTMYNSAIMDSKADREGGAIYFVGSDSERTVSLIKTLITRNHAPLGSVWAMDCERKGIPTTSPTSISHSSIVENGNYQTGMNSSSSIIDYCGAGSIDINASTIAKNKVNQQDGSIIQFNSRAAKPLDGKSLLGLISNTIVENDAANTVLYDNKGMKAFNSNIVAFNTGKSCSYALNGGNTVDQTITMIIANNALDASCTIPSSYLTEATKNIIIPVGTKRSDLLSDYKPASPYNIYLPLYYPLDKNNNADFVNAGHMTCSESDQREIFRVPNGTLLLSPENANTCDIGSVELMRLTAADIQSLNNTAYSEMLAVYDNRINQLEVMLNDPENASRKLQIQAELNDFNALSSNTKKYAKYRAIYIDPFELALPKQIEINGELRNKPFESTQYIVSAQAKGVGRIPENITNGTNLFPFNPDDQQVCEWVPELKRIMFYRKDGALTPTGLNEFCVYTITEVLSNSNGVVPESSSGILTATFNNIAPVAKDDVYTLRPENNLRVEVNPLSNDFDDDGPIDNLAPEFRKTPINLSNTATPIRFDKIDSSVLTMRAEREGLCVDGTLTDKCYGGKITFEVKNNLSQFDYPITYYLYDEEGAKSKPATIYLKNSAKNTNNESSGGGAINIIALFGLLGIAAYRSRRLFKS